MPAESRATTPLAPLILIVTLFFLWGVANNLNDVLMPHLRKAFFLTDLQSSLVQSAFYLGYFFLALPAGWAIQRWGYQRTVLIGLLVFGAGATHNHAEFVYDASKKTLFWDSDGVGGAAAVAGTAFSTAVTLTHSDFMIV